MNSNSIRERSYERFQKRSGEEKQRTESYNMIHEMSPLKRIWRTSRASWCDYYITSHLNPSLGGRSGQDHLAAAGTIRGNPPRSRLQRDYVLFCLQTVINMSRFVWSAGKWLCLRPRNSTRSLPPKAPDFFGYFSSFAQSFPGSPK